MSDLKEEREPARVRYTVGFTKNVGNFESLRMEVAVEDSARPGEKVSELSNRVYTFASKELMEKLTEVANEAAEVEKKARREKK